MSGYGRRSALINANVRREEARINSTSCPHVFASGQELRVRDALRLTFEHVLEPEYLLGLFQELKQNSGPAPGVDGFSYADYSITEIAAVLREVCWLAHAGRYVPSPSLVVPIPRPDRALRELRLRTIVDRIISTAVNRILSKAAERILQSCCLAYRPGISTWDMLVAIEFAVLHRESYFFQQDDIRRAFDNVPLALAIAACQSLMSDVRLRQLIEAVLRGHDTCRNIGIEQGDPLSPLALNLVMHSVLDLPLTAAAQNGFPLYLRYADNLVVLGRSALDVAESLGLARRRLAEHGMTLKGEDGGLTHLRRPGASVKVLGSKIHYRRRFQVIAHWQICDEKILVQGRKRFVQLPLRSDSSGDEHTLSCSRVNRLRHRNPRMRG
ncbi:reverse transcriptase domain-containing protein [Anatilimnocola floriformis]|uniref:reverse transcriptase domain-containing protein n=1 Tax=Anatilimnocola floriformis TaxID=2948575 RepID=UPI0020C2EB27|nr:reverse transcriptase domain-containing protein [Anatilimnocola floriformis]